MYDLLYCYQRNAPFAAYVHSADHVLYNRIIVRRMRRPSLLGLCGVGLLHRALPCHQQAYIHVLGCLEVTSATYRTSDAGSVELRNVSRIILLGPAFVTFPWLQS